MQIRDKTVILTGASRGLGRVMAGTLARAGARLVLAARSAEQLEETVRAHAPGVHALAVPCDVTQAEDRQRLVACALESFGTIDVLINNAGIEELSPFAEQDPAIPPRIIETNLLAPMLLARAVLPAMLERRSGHIVNIASLAGRTGMPYGSVYAGSKGGLAEWSISLAAELRGSGVEVSVICPGFVSGTGLFARKHRQAPRTLGTSAPEEVAQAVLDTLIHPRVEVVVNPKPARLLMALRALSPELALALSRRLGLVDFLRSLAVHRDDE